MTKGDQVVERVADKARATAERLAHEDGLKSKLAPPLAEDAEFLRKLKPSLMKARAKGEAPTNEEPGTPHVAPSGPQLGERPKRRGSGGPNPFVVAGAALVAGVLLAKWLDWRGHAHPRG